MKNTLREVKAAVKAQPLPVYQIAEKKKRFSGDFL